ncbi:MAG: dihydroxyacetone kinase subunit DhaK [Hyphomicrobiales bacterium]|nr:dihydroxyacetone kinase subunit DhaK [Hyphomicrobiales bacterium]
MNLFLNEKNNIVTEAIDGLVRSSSGRLSRLDGFPHIRVVTRSDWDKSKVALISGGGSGHEPAHAGFVGRGMLTAAVCGDVFASPSVDAVLAGILAVTGPAGCLLIVKNYTGDRLNFGLAAERAKSMGLKVSMVIVDDDIALPDLPQPRGLAGTLFVHKIAGCLAEHGKSLEEITAAANNVIAETKTISMSLDTCNVPGSPKSDRIPEGRAELGLGIHGEAGIEQIEFKNAKDAMGIVATRLAHEAADGELVVLLNNLGGASALEMSVLSHELINSSLSSRIKWMVGPGSLMTSLDMKGFSVTVFSAKPEELECLNEKVDISAWPGCNEVTSVDLKDLPGGLKPERPNPSEDPETRKLLQECCSVLIDSESDLNALDSHSGDGDTGSTLAGAARSLIQNSDRLPFANHSQLLKALGLELSESMGGSSGVLLAIFFASAGDAATNGASLHHALQKGLEQLQEVGGAKLGDRSMVDALKPGLEALEKSLADAAQAARSGANKTAEMSKAKVGRATYIGAEQLTGHVDPGAEAVARIFEHLAG